MPTPTPKPTIVPTLQPKLSCNNIASGAFEMRSMYQAATVSEENTCVSQIQNRLCTNGQFGSWSGTYTQSKCTVSRVRFENNTVNAGATCKSQTQVMTCENAVCALCIPNNYTNISCHVLSDASTTTSITQYGITWTFSSPVKFGKFINEDYWVIDPGNGISVQISPPPLNGLNGSQVNPRGKHQPFDSRAGNYDKNLLFQSGGKIFAGDSLISTISETSSGDDKDVLGRFVADEHSFVQSAAVLTALSAVPPPPTHFDHQKLVDWHSLGHTYNGCQNSMGTSTIFRLC